MVADDEYPALLLVQYSLHQVGFKGQIVLYRSPLRALTHLRDDGADLMFIDINMPMMTGIELLRSVMRPPVTVLTTAYTEHALEAFDLNVADYLVKPFAPDRFRQAYERAMQRVMGIKAVDNISVRSLKVRSGTETVVIPTSDILFIQGYEEYVRIHTTAGLTIAYERMKNIEATLAPDGFIRVHRSFIIALRHVRRYTNAAVTVGDVEIPISRQSRNLVLDALNGI